MRVIYFGYYYFFPNDKKADDPRGWWRDKLDMIQQYASK